jgi:hypothetical protein
LTGSVCGPYRANPLTQKLGYGVAAGEPYYTPGCTSGTDFDFGDSQLCSEEKNYFDFGDSPLCSEEKN